MKVLLLKDWSKYKKGEVIDLKDLSVAKKGISVGIFSEDLTAKSETVTTETTVIKTKKVKKNEKDN
jgi:hypothetical protein